MLNDQVISNDDREYDPETGIEIGEIRRLSAPEASDEVEAPTTSG